MLTAHFQFPSFFSISMESTTVVDANSRIIQVAGKLVIKNLVGVMAGFQTGENIESDTFMLGDAPLIIRVYPNGIREEVKGFVSVYLYNPGDAQINVKCQLITDVKEKEFGYNVTLPAKGGKTPVEDTENSFPMLPVLRRTRTKTLLSRQNWKLMVTL